MRGRTPAAVAGCVVLLQSSATPGRRTPEQVEAAFEAHKGDFDYLLGEYVDAHAAGQQADAIVGTLSASFARPCRSG